MKRFIASSFVVAAGLGAGCFNSLFPFAPEQLFETQVRATCRFTFNCCEASERQDAGFDQAFDEATCVEDAFEAGGFLANLGQRAKAAIDKGTAVHDGELAERCLRPFLNAVDACDPAVFFGGNDDADCAAGSARAFVIGQVKDGDDCVDDLECADEGTCVRDPESDVVTVAGTCLARAGEGESCEEVACKSGLQCSFAGDTPTCEAIVLLDNDEPCFTDDECKSGFCVSEAIETCAFSGEPCTGDDDCDEEGGDFCTADDDSRCSADDRDAPEYAICNGKE